MEEVKPSIVLLDFTFSGSSRDGQTVPRLGWASVIVYNGTRQHVEVRNKD